jgi:hypothetical protein
MTQNNTFKKASLAIAGLAFGAISANAQHLIQTNGTIVAGTGDLAPSGGGATFNATNLDTGSLDDLGRLWFRAQLIGTGVTPQNQRAYYVGTDRTNLQLVLRSADPVPTLVNGETLQTATNVGIASNCRFSGNGNMYWSGNIFGGTSTTANDTAIFTGTPGNFVIAVREGDAAPGTAGAIMNGTMAPSAQTSGLNNAGRVVFQSSTSGGDTTTANNLAWFTGTPGNLELLQRKGDSIPSGEVISALGFNCIMNASGAALHDETLSTVLGTPPATSATNNVMMVYTPGVTPGTGTNAVLLREGDPAVGTVGGVMGVSAGTNPFGTGASPWNNNGKALVACNLFPLIGDTVASVNDAILYIAALSAAPVPVVRKGDATGLPGGELFGVVNISNTVINNNDRVAFAATLTGGSVTTANDSSVWFGTPGNLQMIAREGDPAPGTVGASLGSMISFGNFWLNDSNQVTFQADLVGGDVTGSADNHMMYVWSPGMGLTPIIRKNDQIEFTPGNFKTLFTWGGLQFSNNDSRALTMTHGGKIHLGVNFTDSTKAMMTVYLPKVQGTSFCSGDGTGTTCPCGNAGAAGRGCANFTYAAGAVLTGSGVAGASALNDTLVLKATDIPGPGLFFQGDGTFGAGLSFGDGLLCAGGSIIRLGVVFPTGNEATYPGGLTPAPIHLAGFCNPGDVRNYQCWYRDSGETSPGISFCTPATYNLTNGLTIPWGQ